MKFNTKQAELFDSVLIAYTSENKKMDNWTESKYANLKEQFDRKGSLSTAQEALLASLTKYVSKAPGAGKETFIIQGITSLPPEEKFPSYNSELATYVLDFDAKMRTTWVPSKDEIFQYGYAMRRLGAHYSSPKKWSAEFEEYTADTLVSLPPSV
jgi:hypothetical protein